MNRTDINNRIESKYPRLIKQLNKYALYVYNVLVPTQITLVDHIEGQ